MIPVEVLAALAGRPEVGEWDTMFPLLTVDQAGYPHVCLLSRSELAADDDHVYAVVSSPTTISNLWRTPRATLVVITGTSATYLKLAVVSTTDDDDWRGLVLAPAAVKHDGIGVPLTPPRYLAAPSVAADENWERSAQLLATLHHMEKETSQS